MSEERVTDECKMKLLPTICTDSENREGNDEEGVWGSIEYLQSRQIEAVYVASQAGDAKVARHGGYYSSHEVWIRNARLANEQFSLDKEGFVLVNHESQVMNYFNDEELKEHYNHSVEVLVKNVTGARRVKVFDHTRRAASEELRVQLKCREPSKVVHNDYTDESAVKRLNTLFKNEADDLIKRRFGIVNVSRLIDIFSFCLTKLIVVKVWRSIDGVVHDHPMTFCDSESRDPNDLISVKRIANDRVGEVQMAVYNSNHRWYYYPELQLNEVLMFKTFDSDQSEGMNRFTLHTAFQDHHCPENAPSRQSMETRCFVFY